MPSKSGGASSSSETRTTGDSSKDRIQHWIHEQISGFLQKWEGSADQNPALSVVKKLAEATQELDPGSVSCLSAVAVSPLIVAKLERERERERERDCLRQYKEAFAPPNSMELLHIFSLFYRLFVVFW